MKKIAALILSLAFFGACTQQAEPPSSPKNIIRIATEVDPQTLDPRLARTLPDATVMRLIYEGLYRVDSEGKYEKALAEAVDISDDNLVYTIYLKPSYWSDGSLLTADDFVEGWKSVLDPAFPSPNASLLFPITGAQAAKAGQIPLSAIGLKVLSPQSFSVQFDKPIADSFTVLSVLPVHASVRQRSPSADPKQYIYNGPFVLNAWRHHDQLDFTKNDHYWDRKRVKLDSVVFVIADGTTGLNLFQKGQLDWMGSPLSTLPQDAIPSLRSQGVLLITDAAGTYWFRFNTEKAPFDNVNMRKAFNLALARKAIVEHVTQGNQRPALSILPPMLALHDEGFYADDQPKDAKEHFELALNEQGLTSENLPSIAVCYGNNDRNHKIVQAVQQQWKNALAIDVSLQACEGKVTYDKLAKGDYQIMLGSWFADINDPINFLSVFQTKDNGINNTRWENTDYTNLLEQATYEKDAGKRTALLAQAEDILMQAQPVAPLFYNAYNYLKKDSVHDVYFSELGYLDFKNAWVADSSGATAGG